MNISLASTEINVTEGEGVVTLLIRKTDGAIGPVAVRIFTVEGTATGIKLAMTCPCVIMKHMNDV